jgi:positive regulator of sigma E activity
MEGFISETSFLSYNYSFLLYFSPLQGLVFSQQLNHLFHLDMYVIIKLYSISSLNFKNLYNSDPSFFIEKSPYF